LEQRRIIENEPLLVPAAFGELKENRKVYGGVFMKT
jgi:hypothetical protein